MTWSYNFHEHPSIANIQVDIGTMTFLGSYARRLGFGSMYLNIVSGIDRCLHTASLSSLFSLPVKLFQLVKTYKFTYVYHIPYCTP